jgi:hypothetical protein
MIIKALLGHRAHRPVQNRDARLQKRRQRGTRCIARGERVRGGRFGSEFMAKAFCRATRSPNTLRDMASGDLPRSHRDEKYYGLTELPLSEVIHGSQAFLQSLPESVAGWRFRQTGEGVSNETLFEVSRVTIHVRT